MPTWGGILQELNSSFPPDLDGLRRHYLKAYSDYVGRPVILYATAFTQGKAVDPQNLSINEEDIQGLMEVTYGMGSADVDIIIHSPGGSIDAAGAIVDYLRARFSNIRAIVPHLAMSAGTMICCACNEVFMGKHSFLGPVDPQFFMNTPLGPRQVAAHALVQQFKQAMDDCQDPGKINAWIPILSQYGPDILVMAENAMALSREYVAGWLANYMFLGEDDAVGRGKAIADSLADHMLHKSHARHLSRETVRGLGLKVRDLEEDEHVQDLVLSVFHCSTHAFTQTPVVKIIENQDGRAFMKIQASPMSFMPLPQVEEGASE